MCFPFKLSFDPWFLTSQMYETVNYIIPPSSLCSSFPKTASLAPKTTFFLCSSIHQFILINTFLDLCNNNKKTFSTPLNCLPLSTPISKVSDKRPYDVHSNAFLHLNLAYKPIASSTLIGSHTNPKLSLILTQLSSHICLHSALATNHTFSPLKYSPMQFISLEWSSLTLFQCKSHNSLGV